MKTDHLSPPVVNTQLGRMNCLQRSAESFRYVILSLVFWISPEGNIRKWVKANTCLAVYIAAPTLMAFPFVTLALWEFESWINALTAIAEHLIVLPILAMLSLISISIFFKIINVFRR